MKSTFLNCFLVFLFIAFALACSPDHLITQEQQAIALASARNAISDDEATELKKEFAGALAKALKESPSLRELIKNKALEMIDEDYDVLYQLIKHEKLEDGLSVLNLIAKHLKNREKLQVIEAKLPTLTIFVPDLPMGSFSARSWAIE